MVNEQADEIAATTPLTVDFTTQRDLSLALVRTAIAWPVLQATQKAIAALASDEAALGLTIAALPVGRLNTLGWLFLGAARKQQAVTAATSHPAVRGRCQRRAGRHHCSRVTNR